MDWPRACSIGTEQSGAFRVRFLVVSHNSNSWTRDLTGLGPYDSTLRDICMNRLHGIVAVLRTIIDSITSAKSAAA